MELADTLRRVVVVVFLAQRAAGSRPFEECFTAALLAGPIGSGTARREWRAWLHLAVELRKCSQAKEGHAETPRRREKSQRR
jgi:hypothetical protein